MSLPAYLKSIRIRGAPADSEEIVQGMGGDVTLSTTSTSSTGGSSPGAAQEDLVVMAEAWDIQDEMIRMEIDRLQDLLNMMNEAESLEKFNWKDEPNDDRAIPLIAGIGSAIALLEKFKFWIEVGGLAHDIGSIIYDIYKRFYVEKEELKHLPKAIIDLLESTTALLQKLKGLEQTRENFEFRQDLLAVLSEKVNDQMMVFRRGTDHVNEQIGKLDEVVQRLEDLQYNSEEYQLPSGLIIRRGGKLLGTQNG